MNKKEKGMTLVALIVTIIVMLILAGVAINLSVGKNGIFQKSEQSVGIHNKQEATEKVNLKITHTQMRVYIENQRMPTLQEIANDFCEDEEVEYVELESRRLANIDKVEVGEAKSFFTKLKKYPYEFEINSSMQLASIDGVKIADSSQDEKYETILKRLEDLEKQQDNKVKPMNIQKDAYILNTINDKSTFSNKTSMSGLTRQTDENNNITEYLSFSETDGYTVLKEGWYLVQEECTISSVNATDLTMFLYLNGMEIMKTQVWTYQGAPDRNANTLMIYFQKGDKFYFLAHAAGENANTTRQAIGRVYPMC